MWRLLATRIARSTIVLSPQEVVDRLIVPSGLAVIGNLALDVDPDDFGGANARYTFGSLFLGKPGRLSLPPESAPMRLDAFPALARREAASPIPRSPAAPCSVAPSRA